MPQLADIKDPKSLSDLISYSALSVAELRQRRVAPHNIHIVETNRDQLKSVLETQRNFRDALQKAAYSVPGQQRNVSNPMVNAP